MGSVRIDRLDHLVPIVADLDATVEFYTRVLDMQAVTFGTGRTALTFGHSKINLHRPVTSSSRRHTVRRHRGASGRTHRRHRPHPQRPLPRPGPEPDRGQQLRLIPAWRPRPGTHSGLYTPARTQTLARDAEVEAAN
jgi:catechol 2,3-dioxygenase-like lactoylglutathione lyase family enzyme